MFHLLELAMMLRNKSTGCSWYSQSISTNKWFEFQWVGTTYGNAHVSLSYKKILRKTLPGKKEILSHSCIFAAVWDGTRFNLGTIQGARERCSVIWKSIEYQFAKCRRKLCRWYPFSVCLMEAECQVVSLCNLTEI